ncbi:hypothetical protein ACRAKI_21705 [Saccharothrix isguenensis]
MFGLAAMPGFELVPLHHADGKLGVTTVSKSATRPDPLADHLDYLPVRATGVVTDTDHGHLHVLGVYVSPRDASLDKTGRKKRWLAYFQTGLDAIRTDTCAVPEVESVNRSVLSLVA